MLKPILSQIKGEEQSTYSFVYAVAKRAREIAEELDTEEPTDNCEKPVDLAVEEFTSGKVRMGRVVTIDEKKRLVAAAQKSLELQGAEDLEDPEPYGESDARGQMEPEPENEEDSEEE